MKPLLDESIKNDKKIKGIVLEINSDYITILTPNGHFVKVKGAGVDPLVGEEVILPSYN